jgi:hypothetical protein
LGGWEAWRLGSREVERLGRLRVRLPNSSIPFSAFRIPNSYASVFCFIAPAVSPRYAPCPMRSASHLLTFAPSFFPLCAMPHALTFPPSYLLSFPPSACLPRHSPALSDDDGSDFRLQNSHLLSFPPSEFISFPASHLPTFSSSIFSAFRIFSRGIVPPYRTTTGPPSEFICPLFSVREFGSVLICQFN